jgi:hypothetical protein
LSPQQPVVGNNHSQGITYYHSYGGTGGGGSINIQQGKTFNITIPYKYSFYLKEFQAAHPVLIRPRVIQCPASPHLTAKSIIIQLLGQNHLHPLVVIWRYIQHIIKDPLGLVALRHFHRPLLCCHLHLPPLILSIAQAFRVVNLDQL